MEVKFSFGIPILKRINRYTETNMRAREFVINVPITIKINGDGDPEIDTSQDDLRNAAMAKLPAKVNDEEPKDPQELDPNPVMVPPLQQQIEINKASVGKTSPVIDDLTQDEEDTEDMEDTDDIY